MAGTTLTVLMDHIVKSTGGRHPQMKKAWTGKGGNTIREHHVFPYS